MLSLQIFFAYVKAFFLDVANLFFRGAEQLQRIQHFEEGERHRIFIKIKSRSTVAWIPASAGTTGRGIIFKNTSAYIVEAITLFKMP